MKWQEVVGLMEMVKLTVDRVCLVNLQILRPIFLRIPQDGQDSLQEDKGVGMF